MPGRSCILNGVPTTMPQEDIKTLDVFTTYGGQFGIKTRMPSKEIHAEMIGGDDRHGIFIILIGLDDANNHVEVNICRDHLSAYFIRPMKTSMIAKVAPKLLQ